MVIKILEHQVKGIVRVYKITMFAPDKISEAGTQNVAASVVIDAFIAPSLFATVTTLCSVLYPCINSGMV